MPACHADKHNSCSSECNAEQRARARKARERACLNCGKIFLARGELLNRGYGKYCGIECRNAVTIHALHSPESRAKAGRALWRGGRLESNRRRIKNGKLIANVRDWRRRNPDKVRQYEREQYRRNPTRGAAAKARRRARVRAQICEHAECHGLIKTMHEIRPDGCHIDHIVPIARGGLHCIKNLQFLPAKINRQKGAR